MKTFVFSLLAANLLVFLFANFLQKPNIELTAEIVPAFQYFQFDKKLAFLDKRVAIHIGADDLQPVASEPVSVVEASLAASTESSVSTGVPWCGAASALVSDVVTAQFEMAASTVGAKVNVRRIEVPQAFTWWVHTAQYASESAARADLQDMQKKNIDSFYMRSGELRGRISLGVFSREESARQVQSEIIRQGFVAEISRVEKTPKDRQITVTVEDRELLRSPEWIEILDKNIEITLSEIECK